MNKQSKTQLQNLSTKIEVCLDDLGLLLDLIYKFPQLQREKYYDRIQLLKQNITQLKICMKDTQTAGSMGLYEKKYQQILIKINELKVEINGNQGYVQGRKKRQSNSNNQFSTSFIEENSKQFQRGAKSNPKQDYDQIMATIVQKSDQVKKYRVQCEQLTKTLIQYQQKQQQTERLVLDLQDQLQKIRVINQNQANRNAVLMRKLQNANGKCQQLENICQRMRKQNHIAEQQMQKISGLLEETLANYKLKKIQCQNYLIQLTTFQEKYHYDLKQYIEKQDLYKSKQKNYQKKVKDLEKIIQQNINIQEKYYQLEDDYERNREDKKVLEKTLAIKEEVILELNFKMSNFQEQIRMSDTNIQAKDKTILQSQDHINQLLKAEKENHQIISMLENQIKKAQDRASDWEQQRQAIAKKSKHLQQSKEELQELFMKKQEYILKLSQLVQKNERKIITQQQDIKKLQQQLNNKQVQMIKIEAKHDQTGKRFSKLQKQNSELHQIIDKLKKQQGKKSDNCKLHQKQIQNLKKKVFRAKIQCIHDIRQVLV